MAAAELTPSVVQKTYVPSTGLTGTPLRLVKYTFKATKATQNDWVVTATAFQSGTPVFYRGNTVDSSSDGVTETMTYTNSGTKLTLTSTTVGTVYGEVWFTE